MDAIESPGVAAAGEPLVVEAEAVGAPPGVAADVVPGETPRRRGYTILAWVVILGLTIWEVGWLQRPEKQIAATHNPGMRQLMARVQVVLGQYLVAAAQMPGAMPELYYQQYQTQVAGGFYDRLRSVAVAGELLGPKRAAEELAALRNDPTEPGSPTADEQAAADTLGELYAAYEAGDFKAEGVSPERREQLRQLLGWHGELALAPKDTPDRAARAALLSGANRTLLAMLGAGLFALSVVGVGLVAACVLAALAFKKHLRARVLTGSSHGGIYAETFAVWNVTFMATSILVGSFAPDDLRFGIMLIVFPGSLVALLWPVGRGVSWSQVRADIGWTRGSGLFFEGAYGVLTYVATLPLLMLGVFSVVGLMKVIGGEGVAGAGPSPPAHPIIEELIGGNWGLRVQLLLLASVAAPLVEETMFRGVLYRHLRELTAPLRIAASVAISVVVTSFLFAIIHPQGPIAVPALGALAAGFALSRQWRGSLIAPMTAHAINNGLATAILLSFI